MKADIEWLAAPEREGRGAGSRGLDAAANYIAERFERLGLSPLTPERVATIAISSTSP